MVQRHLIAALFSLAPLYAVSCSPAFLIGRVGTAWSVAVNAAVKRPAFARPYRLRAEQILDKLAPDLHTKDIENGCPHAYFEVNPTSQPLLEALLHFSEGGPPILFGYIDARSVKVTLKSASTTQSTSTDSNGNYWFRLPNPGRYRIEASHQNQPIAFRNINDGFLEEFEIPPNISAFLEGFPSRTPGIAGRLLTSTGASIPYARVTAIQPKETFGRIARTGSDGSFHIPDLPPGPYHLVASPPNRQPNPLFLSGYYANKATIEVPKNGHGNQNIEFRAAPPPKLIPIRAFLTPGSYHDHRPGQKITFSLLNPISHVDLFGPEFDFTCTLDSALSCFIPLAEGELYRPTGVRLPEWTVRATPGAYIYLP